MGNNLIKIPPPCVHTFFFFWRTLTGSYVTIYAWALYLHYIYTWCHPYHHVKSYSAWLFLVITFENMLFVFCTTIPNIVYITIRHEHFPLSIASSNSVQGLFCLHLKQICLNLFQVGIFRQRWGERRKEKEHVCLVSVLLQHCHFEEGCSHQFQNINCVIYNFCTQPGTCDYFKLTEMAQVI